jgi:ABC-type lipoprotein export system ATPase subunit
VALPMILANVAPPEILTRVLDAMRRTGVSDLAGRLPDDLSGGQAQRVAVARAVACAPRLILADEPTGQLDAAHRDQIVDLLLQVADDYAAGLVIATHDPAVAARLPQRWVIREGRLVEEAAC